MQNPQSPTNKPPKDLTIIGATELVDINQITNIPAKIDTGADSSAIWASNITITPDQSLSFTLFAPTSSYYTGEKIITKDFKVAKIRSSNGIAELRYRTHLSLKIQNRQIKALFNLSDRSKNRFPILIGRRTLNRKFLVNVAKHSSSPIKTKFTNTQKLNQELKQNPYLFHKKYFKQEQL